MRAFKDYSQYYNLLYGDKDYNGESNYIESLICEYLPRAKTILDLGCGTGRHDSILSEKGYRVHGIDLSQKMLAVADEIEKNANLLFSHGDIRDVRLYKKYDVVLSLFHVLSYQVNNSDLFDVFKTAAEHLRSGGIFIFDCWYGPGVLTDRPTVRIKRVEDDEIEIIRIAEPILYPNENLVDVNYQLLIRNKLDNRLAKLQETHKMRYLFKPEVEMIINHTSFTLITCEEWMTRKEPDYNSWNVVFVVEK